MDNAYFLDTTLLYETEEKKKKRWPIFLAFFSVVLIIPLVIFGLQKLDLAKIAGDSKEKIQTILPKDIIEKTPAISKSFPSPTPVISKTPKEIVKADLKLNVRNGSGVAGAALRGESFLKNLGYSVVSSGNAENFNYKGLTIRVKNSKKEYLEILEKDLKTNYFNLSSSSSDLEEDSSFDALVIIGR